MSAVPTTPRADGLERDHHNGTNSVRRVTTETKAAFKTTEFFAFLAVLIGVLISAAVVDDGSFGASKAWLYATILTVGYMVSRGLAKAGSQQPYDEDRS